MAQYKVKRRKTLPNYNTTSSAAICSGGGKLLEPILVKSPYAGTLKTACCRVISGVHTDIIELLAALINKNVYPCIYEHGGVGASGDLVQLAPPGTGADWRRRSDL